MIQSTDAGQNDAINANEPQPMDSPEASAMDSPETCVQNIEDESQLLTPTSNVSVLFVFYIRQVLSICRIV